MPALPPNTIQLGEALKAKNMEHTGLTTTRTLAHKWGGQANTIAQAKAERDADRMDRHSWELRHEFFSDAKTIREYHCLCGATKRWEKPTIGQEERFRLVSVRLGGDGH